MAIKKIKTSDGPKLQNTQNGKLAGSAPKKSKAPTASVVSKSFPETAEEKRILKETKPLSSALTGTIRTNSKVRRIIRDHQKFYDYPEANLEEQLEEFRLWALPESSTPDISAPDENFRYDLMEPVVGSELQLKAFRRLGYEHYLAQNLPIFFSEEEIINRKRLALIEGAVASVASAKVPGATFATFGNGVIEGMFALKKDEYASIPGRLYYLKEGFPNENLRSDIDKASHFNKDNLEASPYIRIVLELPSERITRRAWVYFANDKTQGG